MIPTPARSLLLGSFALLLAACGVAVERTPTGTPSAVPPHAATSTLAPSGSPTPDLEILLRDGGIAVIQTAYDRLLDTYIEPLDSSRLLDGAWTLLVQQADAEGIAAPAKPAFTDDRAGDFGLFRNAFVRMAAQSDDPTQLRYAAVRGMTQALQDCHTFFLNPVASSTLTDQRAGNGTVGIGVELAGIPPLVTEVITGGPAARAGVLVGDRVTSVDGTDATGLGPAGALDLINGDEGTAVRLELQRPGADGLVGVTATRARVTPPNVETRTIGANVGYVRVRNFTDGGVAGPLRDALTAFEATGVTAWILDLRGNPGGRLDPDAMSLFIADGVTARDRDRTGALHEDTASGATLPLVRPTVVLTNNRTGSVAEVFAAALQEYGVATVVGANSNGCVGYTDIQPLGDGSSMAVTTHVNLGPVTNTVLNGVGVVPDIAVARTAEDIANARDPQLDAAVAYLSSN